MTICSKLHVVKLCSMVGDECMGKTISTNDILPNKLIHLVICHINKRLSFHPLSKEIHRDHGIFKSSPGRWKWPDQVYSPHGKWQRGSDGCQQCLLSSSDGGKALALVTFLGIGYIISPHRRPVVSLRHHPLQKRPTCYMGSTGPFIDLFNQFFHLGGMYTSLQTCLNSSSIQNTIS